MDLPFWRGSFEFYFFLIQTARYPTKWCGNSFYTIISHFVHTSCVQGCVRIMHKIQHNLFSAKNLFVYACFTRMLLKFCRNPPSKKIWSTKSLQNGKAQPVPLQNGPTKFLQNGKAQPLPLQHGSTKSLQNGEAQPLLHYQEFSYQMVLLQMHPSKNGSLYKIGGAQPHFSNP